MNSSEGVGVRVQIAVLRWIFRRWFIQSEVHKRNVRRVYGLIRLALIEEFIEDNMPTLREFSDECYRSAWHDDLKSVTSSPEQEEGL